MELLFGPARSLPAGPHLKEVDKFLDHLEETVRIVNEEFGGTVIRHALQQHRQLSAPGVRGVTGDHYGTLKVILTGELEGPPNDEIIDAWRAKIQLPGGIESSQFDKHKVGHHRSQSRSGSPAVMQTP